MSAQEEDDLEIKLWRLRKQIERLERTETNNSVVTLIAPPTEEIPSLVQMLNQEATQAACIKSRVNRQAVQAAITAAAYRVQQYGRTMPKNGLCVFAGEVYEDGKLQKVVVDFSPCKPVANFLYSCDGRFHVEEVRALLTLDDTYGFMVMDGKGVLFATLCGSHLQVLYRQTVDLPKKHGRGGQSSVRFARLREEARHNYVHIVAEHCVRFFIDQQTNMPNVKGIVFAGSAEFKDVLQSSDLLDPRVKKAVVATVDVAYGMEQGLQQAIELAGDQLRDVRIRREAAAVAELLDHVARDTKRAAYGLVDVVRCLAMGAVERVVVWEDLPYDRVVYARDGAEHVGYENVRTRAAPTFVDDDFAPGPDDRVVARENFVEHLVQTRREMNVEVQLVTDRSADGAQFCQGFGGLGATLRWPVDLEDLGRYMDAAPGGGDADFSDLSDFM